MALRITFIGYGEVGQTFGRDLVRKGVSVFAYDVRGDDPAGRKPLAETAATDGVRLAASLAEAMDGAEFAISAVTADQATTAARSVAPHLRETQTYIDLNSVSPATKREVAAALGPGARFVEFAVMSPVAGLGMTSPILAGGAGADEIADRLNAFGMRVTPVSAEIGVASATKLCRSIVIKGLEAIMVDLSLAAPTAGVMEGVLKSLTASYPGMDWAELARMMPGRVARHGVRRAAEMREAARMLEELGLSGAFLEAIADRHALYARQTRED